ncbi:MAG: RNA polymerase-binding protein DksA [Gammaproteobacteria bacterium]|nr:RNA polymerase-binding protein DksA [Gammaproteobacteria bacterium]MBT5204069.1 RNA polymerase-binding protein DksA [Gammaproteobacteria bacterium]MBT5602855.1 RNA polymerase-binding protein DksA [Gammaproteobacteria bacterium]MBT6246263.1 RNA polymerase-binding protein DksA [Gammaproteobacteria bacterium]
MKKTKNTAAKSTASTKPASSSATDKKLTKAEASKKTSQAAANKPKTKSVKSPATAKKATTAKANKTTKANTKNSLPKRAKRKQDGEEFTTFKPYVVRKNEEYMNENQKNHFNSMLLDWRKQLMEEVDRTVSHMKDEAANYPDPSDRASQEEEFSIELRTRDRERKLIRKIEKTIDLLDQDDYGYCESCGVEIGIRRLEARPTATQCIDCKTLDELKERQIHG